MGRWRAWLGCLVGLLGACTVARSPEPVVSLTPSLVTTPILTVNSPSATLRIPSATPTLPGFTSTPPSPSLTPSPAPGVLPLISAAGAGDLVELARLDYSPWDLVTALAWSPDGAWLGVAAGEKVYLYDAPRLILLHELEVGAWSGWLAFRPGGSLLAVAAKDGTVQLWDAQSGSHLLQVLAHAKGANRAAFDPTGQLMVTAGNDPFVRIWDLSRLQDDASGEVLLQAEMVGSAFVIPALALSPDGSTVASVDLRSIRLRDTSTQRLAQTLRGETAIFSLGWRPGGGLLAAGEVGNRLRLWDVSAGRAAGVLQPPVAVRGDPFVWGMDFSPDGEVVAAGSSAGTLALWSVESGDALAYWQAHTRAVSALSFSPDGRRLVSGGLDAVVRIWSANP